MIKARHIPFYVWFFRQYSKVMIHRYFSQVSFHGEFLDSGYPVLLVGNHFSWWDGFIANLLNIKFFHRKFHVMMLEGQLRKRMFLNKAGAYSIKPGTRSVLQSLDYTVELLKNGDNLVTLYPQGEFQPLSRFPVRFESGADRIINDMAVNVHLVFYAALIDYFDRKKPSLNIYFEEVVPDELKGVENLERRYNQFLSECINLQIPG